MIKAEVVFSGDTILIGDDYGIHIEGSMRDVYLNHVYVDSFYTVEQAIAYCLEHKA